MGKSNDGYVVRFPWRKEDDTEPEPPALVRAAFGREVARNDEAAAKRLAAEAEGLRTGTDPAAAVRAAALEHAAQARARDAERERSLAQQITEQPANPSDREVGANAGADDVESVRAELVKGLAQEAERLAAEAETMRSAATEQLTATMRAALRDEAAQLRADIEVAVAKRTEVIERGAEKRARRAESERAEEARTLMSNAADRISSRGAKRLAKESRVIARGANDWQRRTAANLAEGSARQVEERAKLLADETARRQAETAARLDAALETKATDLRKRLADEAEQRHRDLVTSLHEQVESSLRDTQARLADHASVLERAGAERAEKADAVRAEEAASSTAEMKELLNQALSDARSEVDRIRAQTKTQLADHVTALERAGEKRAERTEAARAEHTEKLFAATEKRLREVLADQLRVETDRVQGEAEAQLAKHATTLERASEQRADRFESAQAESTEKSQAEVEKQLKAALAELRADADRIREQTTAQLAEHTTALERAGAERAGKADAARAEEAAASIAKVERRLEESLNDLRAEADRIREQTEKRAEQFEAARVESAEKRLIELEKRSSAALADGLRVEADRIRGEAEAQLAERNERLQQLGAELEAKIADADREAAEATIAKERYLQQLRKGSNRKTPPGTEPTYASKGVPLDANEATLDDLRALGLSLTQATRMLSFRDALGGFSALQQVDEVPGISSELRTGLRRSLTVKALVSGAPTGERALGAPAKATRIRLRPRR